MSADAELPAPSRARGRPPALDRGRIVAAARSLGPGLTMRALADELGVDRKTLSNHVTDREGLLTLVASDVFHDAVSNVDLAGLQDWAQTVSAFGRSMRRGFLAAGALSDHVQATWVAGPESLVATDGLLRSLGEAGFGDEDAVRALVLITEVAFSSARDVTLTERGNHRLPEVEAVLSHTLDEELGAVRRAVSVRAQGPDEQQFEFDLEVLVAGLRSRLAPREPVRTDDHPSSRGPIRGT